MAVVDELKGHSLLMKKNVGPDTAYWRAFMLPKFVTNGVIGWMHRLPNEWDTNGYTAAWHTSSSGSRWSFHAGCLSAEKRSGY